MNTETPKNQSSEEVDLGQMFNAIGRVFDRFFRFIGRIFEFLFSIIIYSLKIVLQYIKLILAVILVAFIVGLGLESLKPITYEGQMLVRPYFDSKYELINNIDYYNSLINNGAHETISNIFSISSDESKSLLGFKIEKGPESENEILQQYDEYLNSIDSTRVKSITYNQYVENRNMYSSNLFLITAESSKQNVFHKLEKGFESTFSNEYSKKQMRIRDETLDMKKSVFERDLQRIDSLQKVYLEIKRNESEKGSASLGIEGLIPLKQEKSTTFEYELFNYEMRFRDSISKLNQLKIEESSYYDLMSSFPKVGKKSNNFKNRYSVILPFAAFLLLCVIYLTARMIKYVTKYEK